MKPLRSSILPFNRFSVSCKHSKKGIIQGGSSWRFTKKQRCSLSKFISLSDRNITPVYISGLRIFFFLYVCLISVRLENCTVFLPNWESWALNWYMQNCLGRRGDLSISNQGYLTSTASLIDAYGLVREVFGSYEVMHAQITSVLLWLNNWWTSMWIQAESGKGYTFSPWSGSYKHC